MSSGPTALAQGGFGGLQQSPPSPVPSIANPVGAPAQFNQPIPPVQQAQPQGFAPQAFNQVPPQASPLQQNQVPPQTPAPQPSPFMGGIRPDFLQNMRGFLA